MADVISFKRLTGESRSVQMLESGGWEVTETWQATFDGEVTDPLDFLGDAMLPAIGTEHPENSILYLKSVPNGAAPKDTVLNAMNFTLVWSTQVLSAASKHDPDRYVDGDRATKSWSHRVVQVPVEKAYVTDNDGIIWSNEEEPIQNTVKDLIIPGISKNKYMPTCRYSRNELVVPVSTLDLPGSVNDDTFTIDGLDVEIGQAMIIACPISALKRSELGEFRTVDYEILIKEDGWDESLLNRGFYSYQIPTLEYDIIGQVVDGVKKICQVKNGLDDSEEDELLYRNVEEPVALNEYGVDRHQHEKWNVDHPGLTAVPFEPHYRKFRYERRISFSTLGFT